MEVKPNLKVVRFDQVAPGDLFIVHDGTGPHVAIAVKEKSTDTMLMLILSPASAVAVSVHILTGLPSHTLVVFFSKDYTIRLPCDARVWFNAEPQSQNCLVLSQDKLYIRAVSGPAGRATPCYIDINDGVLLMGGSGVFARPTGDCAYAVEWSFWTTESEPREIFTTK
jgi:hypothetical protein